MRLPYNLRINSHTILGGKSGLKGVPGGRNELQVVPRVDFDIVGVLEGWELGNKGLYTKYWSYKKKHKDFKMLF